jgi:hypothetical protein
MSFASMIIRALMEPVASLCHTTVQASASSSGATMSHAGSSADAFEVVSSTVYELLLACKANEDDAVHWAAV